MTASFFKSVRHLGAGWSFILSAIALLCGGHLAQATEVLSSWDSSVTTRPQIDAINFYNSGDWNIFTPTRFTTANTLNYTNTGTMNASIGWEFDWGPAIAGQRGWSSSFLNKGALAKISASTDGSLGYLWISATNIINQGQLIAGFGSEIKLTGSLVDLSRSYTEIAAAAGLPTAALGSANNFAQTNFTASAAVFDQYWGQGGISNIPPNAIWTGGIATNGPKPFLVNQPCGVINVATTIGIQPTLTSSKQVTVLDPTKLTPEIMTVNYTNANGSTGSFPLPTNVIRQAVFVSVFDTNITASIRFTPSPILTNQASTVSVRLQYVSNQFITQAPETNAVYLVDTMLSIPANTGFLANTLINPYEPCYLPTFRPANYTLSRTDPGQFAAGTPGVEPAPNDFLTTPPAVTNANSSVGFTNILVSPSYTAYSASVDNQFIEQPALSVTNQPGRVRVYANNLNLINARIRGEGQVVLQASNLIGSAGALIDCQNLSFDLGSTNGYLNITNLASAAIKRFHGSVTVWSATWSQTEQVVTPNWTLTTNAPPVENDLTNYANYTMYAMILNATNLVTTIPVTVQNLTLHSTNIVVSDSVNIGEKLLFDGQSLTLNGILSVAQWTFANAPTLKNFTNNGTISIFGTAHFGDDRPTNYFSFVNNGSIISSGQTISSANLQINNGNNQTLSGDFSVTTQTGQLSGAGVYSFGDISFTAASLLINQTTLSSQNALNFNVTGSLSDNRFGSGNNFFCQDGFNLWTKPATGDLLGTTITTTAYYGGAVVTHSWAGLDLGASVAGYTNNVAIGTLVLSPGPIIASFEPLFEFYGTTGGNGMYVSNLDLSLLTDYANEIYIDPSITIYYVSASLNGTNGAEQFLDGQFDGHLRWVQGVTTLVKQKPSSSARFELSTGYEPDGTFKLVNVVMPAQTNIIQASTDLMHWVPIYTNIGSYSNIGPTTVTDPNAQDYNTRFYRAVPGP